MSDKKQGLSNFTRAIKTTSQCVRPDNEWQLESFFVKHHGKKILARGNGLSYSDCCVNDGGVIVDTSLLNHLITFDATTGVVVAQGGVILADLFLLNQKFIPPVIPGTLYTTLAGAVANDVHGKNNPMEGTFGHHLDWIELQIGHQSVHCSRTKNKALFRATIAGLGLTGIIKRVALRLRKASHFINETTEKYTSFQELIHRMQTEGLQYDYQVAWLDFLNSPRALLSLGQHVQVVGPDRFGLKPKQYVRVPKVPMRLINHAVMKQFNRWYYHRARSGVKTLPFWQFNNPLDAINDWNRCYGKKGLLQFQAVFDAQLAEVTLADLLAIIKTQRATPTLAVLKYFTQPGAGLLSFVKPGFTLAIDFINDKAAHDAIMAMNQLMASIGGKIYLAKDILLNQEQFRRMYPEYEEFGDILAEHRSSMSSDLSRRLLDR